MLAIVLQRRDYREFDQVITVLTKDQGKQELLARGVKKVTSKNAAQLEPFCVVDIWVEKGKAMDHLTKVLPVMRFDDIRTDPEKMMAAQFAVQFVSSITRVSQSESALFDLVMDWFGVLNAMPTYDTIVFDGLVVKSLGLLGLFSHDIAVQDAMSNVACTDQQSRAMQFLHISSFSEIVEKTEEYKKLQTHEVVHAFAQFQLERELPDWKFDNLLSL